MSDNVTPFRRPPKRVQQKQQGGLGLKSHRGKAVLVQLLTIAAFALNFVFPTPPESYIGMAVAIGAFLLAYANRYTGMPWAMTHHEHAVRTLMIGYAIWVFASLLTLIYGPLAIVAFYIHLAVIVWALIRAAIGLVLAMLRRPIPNPRGIII
ncbi:MAG TPA: hypothetical protein VHC73_00535 [Vitreimonas sp.]|jgi:uncharacterized membrane protein|nr:hypothetical protein [Vitreimonas sp.]